MQGRWVLHQPSNWRWTSQKTAGWPLTPVIVAVASLPRSDILTPLPAFGIPFEIDDDKGPLLDAPIRSTDGLKALHPIDLQQLSFVGESLGLLKQARRGWGHQGQLAVTTAGPRPASVVQTRTCWGTPGACTQRGGWYSQNGMARGSTAAGWTAAVTGYKCLSRML